MKLRNSHVNNPLGFGPTTSLVHTNEARWMEDGTRHSTIAAGCELYRPTFDALACACFDARRTLKCACFSFFFSFLLLCFLPERKLCKALGAFVNKFSPFFVWKHCAGILLSRSKGTAGTRVWFEIENQDGRRSQLVLPRSNSRLFLIDGSTWKTSAGRLEGYWSPGSYVTLVAPIEECSYFFPSNWLLKFNFSSKIRSVGY